MHSRSTGSTTRPSLSPYAKSRRRHSSNGRRQRNGGRSAARHRTLSSGATATRSRVRTSRDRCLAKIDMLVHPSVSTELPGLISLACSTAGSRRPLFCLVPTYAETLTTNLERLCFGLEGEYVLLVKRTALPLPALAPIKAQRARPQPVAAMTANRKSPGSQSLERDLSTFHATRDNRRPRPASRRPAATHLRLTSLA